MKRLKILPLLILLIAIVGGTSWVLAASESNQMASRPHPGHRALCASNRGEVEELDTAKLIIEFQSSDGDMGVHGLMDSSGWSDLCVFDPNGRLILAASPQSQLKDLGIGSIFFESREPLLEEFSYDDLKAAFPEGEYAVRATSFEGTVLVGEALFSHDVPTPPIITSPELAEDADTAEDVIVSTEDLVIEWTAVTKSIIGQPVTITGYQIIITNDEYEDPNGFSRPIFDVHVGPDQHSLSVPAEFFQPDTVYEVEVLALEESGNQTITVGFFQTDNPETSSETLSFDDADLLIEFNATGGDLGIHAELGAEPWQHVAIFDPNGNKIFDVRGNSSMGKQGLSSLSFESAEPPLDELPLNEFLARFPEGEYTFVGETIEGEALSGTTEFVHVILEAPVVIFPQEDEVVDRENVVIVWEPVTNPPGVEVEVYQLQIFPVDPPKGQDPIDLNIDFLYEVPATITEVKIPAEFLEPGIAYEFEILAIESNGNRTITVGTFVTAESAP